jgi:hypothetical protein
MDEARSLAGSTGSRRSTGTPRQPEAARQAARMLRVAETWLRAEPDPHGAVEAIAGCRQALETEPREAMLLASRT